jgi:hypothetical protein
MSSLAQKTRAKPRKSPLLETIGHSGNKKKRFSVSEAPEAENASLRYFTRPMYR